MTLSVPHVGFLFSSLLNQLPTDWNISLPSSATPSIVWPTPSAIVNTASLIALLKSATFDSKSLSSDADEKASYKVTPSKAVISPFPPIPNSVALSDKAICWTFIASVAGSIISLLNLSNSPTFHLLKAVES